MEGEGGERRERGNGSGRREMWAIDKSGVVHSCFSKGVIFVKEEGLWGVGGLSLWLLMVMDEVGTPPSPCIYA